MLTDGERRLLAGIQEAQEQLEQAVGDLRGVLQGPRNDPVRRAWRALEDSVIALGEILPMCDECGQFEEHDSDCALRNTPIEAGP